MKRPGAAARTAAQALARLLRDERGATLIIGAAAMVVLMVLIGSGADAGRAYMTRPACNRPATPAFSPGAGR